MSRNHNKSPKTKVSNKNDPATLGRVNFDGVLVAVGASAGGLEALERFFQKLRSDLGVAVVVIQHLSPDHKSMMDDLLSKHTLMPVKLAEEGMSITANHVYLIPPAKTMTIEAGRLRLLPKIPHELTLPIDIFFNSMAQSYGPKCVGIVLSGTGSDGAKGCAKIKESRGTVLVQDPLTAKFDGMPRSAMNAVIPDLMHEPEYLATAVNQLVFKDSDSDVLLNHTPTEVSPIKRIIGKLHDVYGIDFSEYKLGTVERRILRRVQVCNLRNHEDYLRYVLDHPEELATLKKEILIPVSSFFRDTRVFAYLKEHVIPELINKNLGHPIRVWVVGCATGEEAYSYSMMFSEVFQALNQWPQLKIFATDVEQDNITFAGAGIYPLTIAEEVGAERIQKFFIKKEHGYMVRNEIRQNIIFAKHNVLTDPPFTKTHLVSCRNTLIYFQPGAQQKAFQRFHYSLLKGGYLVLGSSETLGAYQNDYIKVDARLKIFRQNKATDYAIAFSHSPSRAHVKNSHFSHSMNTGLALSNPILIGQNALIQSYAPPSILIDDARRVVHVYGNAHKYLQFSNGTATLDISRLLVGKLAPSGMAVLHKVMKEHVEFSTVTEVLDTAHQKETLRLVVRPVSLESNADVHYLMSFEPVNVSGISEISPLSIDVELATHERIQTLEADLSATRDSLQATIEELETSNEELQATNEELMSSNEELQSTNEELQSVNEELYTVNSENQEKIEILNRVNNDLENIARASHIPTIFLDESLQITRFTNEITSIFRLRSVDVGRPVSDFSHELDYPDLITDVQKVLRTDIAAHREVRTWSNKWYLVRILPFKDSGKSDANGVVMTFVEITSLKDSQRLQAIIDSLPEHIAVLDKHGVIQNVNKSWKTFAEENGDRGLAYTGPGVNYLDVCRGGFGDVPDDSIHLAAEGIRDVLSGVAESFSMTYPCHSPYEKRWFVMHCKPVEHPNWGVVVSHVNISDWFVGGHHERNP